MRQAGIMTTVAPVSDVRRHELAEFLRTRRERITPEQVGLVRGPRRRTPGLRREEVAHLSSVGVTWYTWLEQARDIQVSGQVLDAVARALLLDVSEREHLFSLAGSLDPVQPAVCPSVTPSVRAIIDQLGHIPACVQNSRYDIVAYNATYGRLLGDLDSKRPEERNCMWLAFTDPEWQESVVDLPSTHRIMAARFRAAMAEHLAEPAWKTLLARLEGVGGVPGGVGPPRGGRRAGREVEVHPQRARGHAVPGTQQPVARTAHRPEARDVRTAGPGVARAPAGAGTTDGTGRCGAPSADASPCPPG